MATDGNAERASGGYDIFISYGRADAARVVLIRDLLIARGHRVFFDAEGIDAGASFPEVIDRAVKSARVVLACWTPDAVQRQWVRIESRIGLDRGTLIAVAVEPLPPEELPAEFYNVNMLNLSQFGGDPADPAWTRLLAVIDRRLGQGGAGPAAAAGSAPTAGPRKKAPGIRAMVAAGVLALAVVGGGVYWLAGGGTALNQRELIAHLDQTLQTATPVVDNAVARALSDGEASDNAKIFWAEAQLISVTRHHSLADRGRFEAAVKKFVDPACQCVIIEGVPFTIATLWTIKAYGAANKMPPAPILTALLDAQNREGWWSSVLDPADRPDNGATYVTAFAIMVLRELDPVLAADPPLRVRASAARQRAVEWLKRRRPATGQNWSDYPDNSLRSESPSFSALATLAMLPEVTAGEARAIARDYVAALPDIAPVNENFSNDTNVVRANGQTFVDNYRHVPTGWEVHALARSYRYLDAADADQAAALLTRVNAISLSDPQLARQDWMLAEQFLGLRGARDALAAKPATSLTP